MEDDPGEGIYRAMIEDVDGLPMLGLVAVKLGVRPGVDIILDQQGAVHRPRFLPGQPNGLSCSPTIPDIPFFALPIAWGGSHRRTVVWRIAPSDLGSELIAQEDTPPQRKGRHLSIGPSGTMTFNEYLRAVQATRVKWKKAIKK